MLKLSEKHSNILLSQPESGMGYQIAEVILFDNRKSQCVIYNADLLVYPHELEQIRKHGSYNYLLEKASNSENEIRDFKVLKRSSFIKSAFTLGTKGADQSPVEYTKLDEIFKRFSAYEKDKRVTENWGLLPGTYATTEKDAENVRTGMDAVARYALPNPDPAKYVFTIEPLQNTEIQRGIVQPANNQPGGGVEIIFTKGSIENTVYPPYEIPET